MTDINNAPTINTQVNAGDENDNRQFGQGSVATTPTPVILPQVASAQKPAPPAPPMQAIEQDGAGETAKAAAEDNPLVATRRAKAVEQLQTETLENPDLAVDLRLQQQSLVRYQAVVNQQQADQYIQDLELSGLRNIADNREKALHLFGFYDFLHQQKESELFVDNLIKVFQLTIFYDDNYVYRYYLAWHYFLKGDRESASLHIQDTVNKIKNKQVSLYASLAQMINVQVMKNQINDLLIKLALPTLDDTTAF